MEETALQKWWREKVQSTTDPVIHVIAKEAQSLLDAIVEDGVLDLNQGGAAGLARRHHSLRPPHEHGPWRLLSQRQGVGPYSVIAVWRCSECGERRETRVELLPPDQ